jgi:Na+/H+-dicarboxylate symporter
MIAVPLIVVSMANGLADLKTFLNFLNLAVEQFYFYLIIAVSIGLVLRNLIKPGSINQ